MTRDLGKTFQIVEPGLSMKKYPCCNRAQRALDALFDMMAEHQVSYDQVEKVIVDINLYDSYLMKYPHPKTGDEAKFSFPHILGAAILRGRVWVDSFTDESATDHALGEARKKIEVIIHPDWPLGRAEARTPVTVKLKDGKVITKEVAASSEPTMEQLINRYKEGAQRVYSSDQAEKSIEQLLNIEKLKDVSELMNLLTFIK
jgi:2-methylcitrate dehydratase PrpD